MNPVSTKNIINSLTLTILDSKVDCIHLVPIGGLFIRGFQSLLGGFGVLYGGPGGAWGGSPPGGPWRGQKGAKKAQKALLGPMNRQYLLGGPGSKTRKCPRKTRFFGHPTIGACKKGKKCPYLILRLFLASTMCNSYWGPPKTFVRVSPETAPDF